MTLRETVPKVFDADKVYVVVPTGTTFFELMLGTVPTSWLMVTLEALPVAHVNF